MAERNPSIRGEQIKNDTILPEKIKSTNSRINKKVPSYDSTSQQFKWIYAIDFSNIYITTVNYNILINNDIILGNPSTSDITLTLPLANNIGGKLYYIKRISLSKKVIISTQSGDLIDGSSNISLNNQYESITLLSDGISNWYII